MTLTIYELEGCPYCERVTEQLQDNEIDYESVWVSSHHSERNEVKRVSGQRQVPVLVDEERGVTMPESENILAYIDRTLS